MMVIPSDDETERIERLERDVRSLMQENQSLAERLDRAEHRAQRKRHILGLMVLAGAFIALVGRALVTGAPRIVEAEWFALRDGDGNRRAVLQITRDTPILAFYDREGRNILQILARNDGSAGMQVLDATGTVRLMVGGDQDGTMGLSAFDTSGRKATGVGIAKNGLAGLAVYDREGRPTFLPPQP